MIHSLDHATFNLLDTKNFQDRLNVGESSQKYMQSIVRRLYRLLSHAHFHHPDIFTQVESDSYLCSRFTYFARHFNMMSADLFIIPDKEIYIPGQAPVEEEKEANE